MSGRVALVTGGSRGIGEAICVSLAGQGASVAAGFSGDSERAALFAKSITEQYAGRVRVSVNQGNWDPSTPGLTSRRPSTRTLSRTPMRAG